MIQITTTDGDQFMFQSLNDYASNKAMANTIIQNDYPGQGITALDYRTPR